MKIFMKYLFGVIIIYFSLRNQQVKYIFKRYITLKIVNPLKLPKYFFTFFLTLWLYHWLLRNKHNENIHEIPFLGPQNIFSLEKPTSKIYFQALHHLEDSESVKVVKIFFFPFYPTLWLHHWLLRSKHNKNMHEIPFLGSLKYIFAWETNKQNIFSSVTSPWRKWIR